jgi:hypothetical protein
MEAKEILNPVSHFLLGKTGGRRARASTVRLLGKENL